MSYSKSSQKEKEDKIQYKPTKRGRYMYSKRERDTAKAHKKGKRKRNCKSSQKDQEEEIQQKFT